MTAGTRIFTAIPCPACGGAKPGPGEPICDRCRSRGVVRAWAEREDLREVEEFARAYRWLREHGQLPGRGGWLDQPAIFCDAVEFVDGLIAEREAEERRRMAREQERAQSARGRQAARA